jgi:ubiquinone/menaquinone biosynthesis C-methylase UbiE
MHLFEIGTVEITPGAAEALAAAASDPACLLDRHIRGDWGDIDDGDRADNEFALQHPQAIYGLFSRYALNEATAVLVITAADRSCTRVLLPAEEQVREVSVAEGYAVWAEGYDRDHNPLIAAEDPLADALLAPLPIASALDIATGTGRYALRLARRGVAVTAIDQSVAMLAVARASARSERLDIDFQLASIGEPLPFASGSFDLVSCALALCHVPGLHAAVAEFARVARPGGHLLITDFHPDVVADGWRTTYERPGTAYLLPNVSHSRAGYIDAVARTGCELVQTIDIKLRDCPPGYFTPTMIRDVGDRNFGLIMLARKPG